MIRSSIMLGLILCLMAPALLPAHRSTERKPELHACICPAILSPDLQGQYNHLKKEMDEIRDYLQTLRKNKARIDKDLDHLEEALHHLKTKMEFFFPNSAQDDNTTNVTFFELFDAEFIESQIQMLTQSSHRIGVKIEKAEAEKCIKERPLYDLTESILQAQQVAIYGREVIYFRKGHC